MNNHNENIDWSSCVERIAESDATAFRELYDGFQLDLYRFAVQVVKSKSLAEDIVQDTFVKIWERRQNLDSQKSIKSFLFTICKNLCFDSLEKAAKSEPLKQEILNDFEVNQIEDTLPNNLERLAAAAIDSLPPQRRLIFEKAKLQDMSYEQIAKELNISKGTVSDHLVKAMRTIRAFLDPQKKI